MPESSLASHLAPKTVRRDCISRKSCPRHVALSATSKFSTSLLRLPTMANVLNATLRLSQRVSTRKVSHVLSGSTRSLSSTSSPAARACAVRNASFVAAFSNSRNAFSGVRAFSTKPEEVEGHTDTASVTGIVNEAVDAQAQQSQESGERSWQPRQREERVLAPSKTIFVSGLPFFATEEDVRKVFEGCGTITNVRFGSTCSQFYTRVALLTRCRPQDFTTGTIRVYQYAKRNGGRNYCRIGQGGALRS